jgi:ABC-type cobalamin/Fe3+-siderophores transport system ATPase subunit
MNNAFNLSGVSFSYGKHRILNNIDLSIIKGSFLSIIGPNGSGKTTLLSVLTGIQKTGKGNILLEDKDVSSYSSADLARKRSYCASIHGDLPAFTVREYISQRALCTGKLFAFNALNRDDNFNYAVDVTGVGKHLDSLITNLSAGEFQLTAIAGAVAQSRNIIILDEPAEHLDIKHSLEIYQLLKRLNAEGSTIITVLHDINTSLNISDHIIALKDGSIVFNGTPKDFLNQGKANEIFDVPFHCRSHPLSGKPYLFTDN